MKLPYSIRFDDPATVDELAPYIGIDPTLFKAVVGSNDRSRFYQRHRIPKRSPNRQGDFREVWEVNNPRLAEAHKALSRRFELFARVSDARFPHVAAHGYVRNKGTLDNARIHCGQKLLLRADIRNFFQSITFRHLERRFIELKLKPACAEALASFVTIDDRLPMGLHASPMLANLICIDLDVGIEKLAQAYGCRYTRYADDISISGQRRLPSRSEVESILASAGFELNERKFRCTKTGQAHYVTGLSVSDSNGPHAPRSMKRRLRQELYYCQKFGTTDHLCRTHDASFQGGINRLFGTVMYVSHIERRHRSRWKSIWAKIVEKDGLGASFQPITTQSSKEVSCYIDEAEIDFQNRKYLALGLAFTEHPTELDASTGATLREHQIQDPFYAGDKTALAKRGLHFTDSHPDLRTSYIKRLAFLPYRAFVVYGILADTTRYEQTYISHLQSILRQRLISYDRAKVHLIFEQNSKVSSTSIQGAVAQVYSELEATDNRRPIEKPKVSIGKKLEHPSFAIPDYLLAVFARFAKAREVPKEMNLRVLQFERLRDKYRLILDADTGTEYSRRSPFQPWDLV